MFFPSSPFHCSSCCPVCSQASSFFLLLLLLVGTSRFAAAQEGEVDSGGPAFTFEQPKRPARYFGFGGGYLGIYSRISDPRLNAVTADLGLDPVESVTLHGGGGYVGIPGLRVGLYGVGGSAETSRELSVNSIPLRRTLRFERHIVAAHVEFPIRILPSLYLFPGLMIGGETNEITLTQFADGTIPFDTLFDAAPFDGITPANLSSLSSGAARRSFHLQPTLSGEFGLVPHILLLRAGGGYAWSPGGDWTNSTGRQVGNGPELNGYFTFHFGASLDIAGLFLAGMRRTLRDGLN